MEHQSQPNDRENLGILFLDDSVERIQRFRREYPKATVVKTAKEAIEALARPGVWEAVALDHDLGDEVFVTSQREDTGAEVARWIVEHEVQIEQIVLHSWNPSGVRYMRELLVSAGYNVHEAQFGVAWMK